MDRRTSCLQTGLEIGEFRKIVQMVQKGEREARQAKKEKATTRKSATRIIGTARHPLARQ